MPTGIARQSTLAFDPVAARQHLWRGVRIPHGLLQQALNKLNDKLEAKETKFFSFQGTVTDSRDVDAHGVQLDAADKILKIADAYGRAGDAAPAAIHLRVDPNTGLFEIIIGGGGTPGDTLEPNLENGQPIVQELAATSTPAPTSLPAEVPNGTPEAQPQVVKIPRGRLPAAVYDALYGDD